jgi:acetolactate synthase-1/2/3 large subunit
MKIKVSDYVVDFFNKNGINTLFTITGGFSMHLNDSFGKNKNYNAYYNHHEQACGYSAVGYSKVNLKPVIVCTTAGCAATNAITPCLVAHQDSLPILFISGQSKTADITRTLNTPDCTLRHYADQDCDIISMVKPITKYAYEITSILEIPSVLMEAMSNLINGRPGPVWISIPIDIQGSYMETDKKIHIVEKTAFITNPEPLKYALNSINNYLKNSSKPLIIAGNGIKLGNCKDKFLQFIEKYNIPVVLSYHGTDLLESDNPLFCGKVGILGDRSGNFAIQNCDLLISLGCRMAQGVIGYNSNTFAREAKIIYIDADENEINKKNIHYSLKVNMDLNYFFDKYNYEPIQYTTWTAKCLHWKTKWLYELPFNATNDENGINPYFALTHFFNYFPENKIIVCSSGSIVTNVWHTVKIKKNDQFIISGQGDMGFELTAAIGACISEKKKLIVPILGEGSLQLNIQELQTIVHHNFPIKILIFNNNSYGANVITQGLYFKNKFGSDNESGLSFPNTQKIADAYGIKYISITKNDELDNGFKEFLHCETPIICEVFCTIQQRVPKLSAVKNADGSFTSRPFEDMEPFLEREEFKKEMTIGLI